jgi:ankyrin repeat protein
MEHKHEAAVEVLLQAIIAAGMDIDPRYNGNLSTREILDMKGQTLLMRASALGLTSTVAKLLVLGADVAAKDANQKDPIDHAANEDVKVAFAKHLAQVEITDQNKNGLLLVFSRHGMPSRLPAVLLAGADLKHTDEAGNTSVWLAMQHKHEAAVEVLLQAMIAAGMDIDAQIIGHMCVCVCVCVDVYVRIHLYTYTHTHVINIYRYIYIYIYKVPNAIPHLEKPVVPKP